MRRRPEEMKFYKIRPEFVQILHIKEDEEVSEGLARSFAANLGVHWTTIVEGVDDEADGLEV